MLSTIFNVLIVFGVFNLPSSRADRFNCADYQFSADGTNVTFNWHHQTTNRSAAEAECQKEGRHLVTIKSQEKKVAFEKWIAQCCNTGGQAFDCKGFLGMKRTNDDYKWDDDDSNTFISELGIDESGKGENVGFEYKGGKLIIRHMDGQKDINVVCEKSIASSTAAITSTTSSSPAATESSITSPSPSITGKPTTSQKSTSPRIGTRTTGSSVSGSTASGTGTTTEPAGETPLIVWISIGIIIYCVIQLTCLFLYVQWDIKRERAEASTTPSVPTSSTPSDAKQAPTPKGGSEGGSGGKSSKKGSI